jgi:C-terminal processing protease CtpA/Prc
MIMLRPAFPTLLLLVVTLFSACREEDPSPNVVANPQNVHVNEWIDEEMGFWYLWKSNLAEGGDKNQDPADYFESILSADDRFSWIDDNYQELLNSLKGVNKEAGAEFALYRDANDRSKVIAQILYVKPASPAATVGLLRGDVISHINDQQMTESNYKELVGKMKENFTIRYKSVNPEAETFGDEKTASLSAVEYSENPNFMHKVIEQDGHKIGYYVYNLFAPGPDQESTVYDEQMDAIFAEFKSANITDLVVDLRFNSGGAETSSINLSSLIGNGVNSTKVFAKREYNAEVTELIRNDQSLGEDFLTRKFQTESGNIGAQLSNNRVYVLTSKRSASASELVINALKPYMDVFIVGDTTYGKNVGSISIYDEEDPSNTWGMQPIVLKIYNSLGQSDYDTGFVPNVYHKDNRLYLYPLGDPREVLLGHAIGQITGTSTAGRATRKGPEVDILGHSADTKRGSYQLTIDRF